MAVPPDGAADAGLRFLFDRAERVVGAQVARVERLEDKSAHVLRFNAAVAGVLATAVALGAGRGGLGASPWLPSTVAGVAAALAASTLMALLAYRTTRYGIGLRAAVVAEAGRARATEEEAMTKALEAYSRMFDHNEIVLARTAWLLEAALWALMTAVVGLAVVAAGISLGVGV